MCAMCMDGHRITVNGSMVNYVFKMSVLESCALKLCLNRIP